MSKYQVIALCGKSASGKDSIQKATVQANPDKFNSIISCTTRPMRDNEQNKIDYYFLTLEEFTVKVLNGEMLEATEFNNWFYGTPIKALKKDKINIGVFNPAGIEALLDDPRLEVTVVLVGASDKTRLMRALNRENEPNCSEICRRYFADEEDFLKADFMPDYAVRNENGDGQDLSQRLPQLIEKIEQRLVNFD